MKPREFKEWVPTALKNSERTIMNILALDCASKTGFATQIDGVIESGVQDFTKRRGETNGILFMRFNKWLNDMQSLAEFDVIVAEKAHHRGGAATEIGVGLFTRAMEFAAKVNAEFMPVHSGSLKKFYVGKGNCSKPEMMKVFEERCGRKAISSDEADAHGLLMFAKEEFRI